ncbi:MAG: autotransporter domain-containing protein, partial [Pseudomonadota bacterium]
GESAFGIEALDVGLITNSGSITTAGNGAIGISVFDGNTVTNTGSIETLNVNATGIRIFSDNTVLNSGSISTALSFSEGIEAGSDNRIENSGKITTLGNNSRGIDTSENNEILTTGMISTSGDNSDGIFGVTGNIIDNRGHIQTTGDGSAGIRVFGTNMIDNRGDITTSGAGSHGIRTQTINSVLNRGNIVVSGAGANGIEVADMSAIANIGRVVSVNGRSFNFGTDGILTLAAPAFIGGEIGLWTNTTVTVVTGKSHSILWDFSTGIIEGGSPNLAGAIPVFYNDVTKQVATIDPSALAASANVLADMSSDVSGLIRYGLARSGPEVTLGFGEGSDVDRRWWISGFGSNNDYDGDTNILDQDFSNAGLAIGYQTDIAQDWSIGGMLGYSTGELQVDAPFTPSFDNEMNGVFGAVYGRKRFGQSFIDLSLSGAFLSHSDTRFVNDNLAPLGLAQAKGSYDSWWLAPEIRVGHNVDLQDNWFLTPSAQVRYTYQSIDGYAEVG